MSDTDEVDLRAAINAVSEVAQNRPRPLRMYDQIYMKTGDMVLQSEVVARWASGKRLAFIGDGDAIGVCVAYLHHRKIVKQGPSDIVVFDFDERICNAVKRFADRERMENLRAELYNCLDAYVGGTDFDCFYTNPPWGESNGGKSVNVFVQRGMEATGYQGQGMVVIADDDELEWPKRVLANVQSFAIQSGFYIQKMIPRIHGYHLDVNLRSCNLTLRALPGTTSPGRSTAITDQQRLANFYGKDNAPKVHYVRERKRLEYGTAPDDEYELELLEVNQ